MLTLKAYVFESQLWFELMRCLIFRGMGTSVASKLQPRNTLAFSVPKTYFISSISLVACSRKIWHLYIAPHVHHMMLTDSLLLTDIIDFWDKKNFIWENPQNKTRFWFYSKVEIKKRRKQNIPEDSHSFRKASIRKPRASVLMRSKGMRNLSHT